MPELGTSGSVGAAGRQLPAATRPFRDTDIETLNREQGLDIDAKTCVFPGNGARMDHAMAVEELLHRDGALELDPETGHYPAHFPPAQRDG